MISFDKIVNKLLTKHKKVVHISEISQIIFPDFPRISDSDQRSIYRTVYQLKSRWKIFPIRNGLYLLEDPGVSISKKIDDHYWLILKKLISYHVGSRYLIIGSKSLELHMKNFEPSGSLIVLNSSVNKKIQIIPGYVVYFQTMSTHNQSKKRNLFTCFHKMSQLLDIDGKTFRICSLEQALLEALTIRKGFEEFDVYVLRRFFRRYGQSLEADAIYACVENRYITAVNRLKEFSKKEGHEEVYRICLYAIKRYGNGCFVSVGI